MAGSNQDQALCALVDMLFTAEMGPEAQWPDIFEALRKVLHFSSAVFIPIDPIDWTLQAGYTHDSSATVMAEYLAHYKELDPYVIELPGLKRPNTPIRFSDIADISRLAQGEFGSFQRQTPYFYALASTLVLKGCPIGVVSIHRRREQPDFDDQEMKLFGWFARQFALASDYARLRNDKNSLKFKSLLITPPPPRKLSFPARGNCLTSTKPLSRCWRRCPMIGASSCLARSDRPLSGVRSVRLTGFTAISCRWRACCR